jgi:flagellar basal body-associated protein FliL
VLEPSRKKRDKNKKDFVSKAARLLKPPKKKVDERKSPERKSLTKRSPKSRKDLLSQKVQEKKGYISANRRLVLILAVVICLVVAFALYSGYEAGNETSANQTNNSQSNATFNIYDDENITFNYPLDWNVSQEVQSPVMVTVYKDNNNLLSVFSENLGNMTLYDKLVEWKSNLLQTSNITYEQAITVDNSKAYDVESSVKSDSTTYVTRGVAFEKNKKVYFLVFVFNQSLLTYKDDMELILNSFHVKEST